MLGGRETVTAFGRAASHEPRGKSYGTRNAMRSDTRPSLKVCGLALLSVVCVRVNRPTKSSDAYACSMRGYAMPRISRNRAEGDRLEREYRSGSFGSAERRFASLVREASSKRANDGSQRFVAVDLLTGNRAGRRVASLEGGRLPETALSPTFVFS